jgi:hypothetical protein
MYLHTELKSMATDRLTAWKRLSGGCTSCTR